MMKIVEIIESYKYLINRSNDIYATYKVVLYNIIINMFSPLILFFISCWITAILSLLLGIIVFTRDILKPLNRAFFLLTISVAIWSGNLGLVAISSSKELALLLCKIEHAGVIFIPITFLHFVAEFLEIKITRFLSVCYIAGLILLMFIPSNLIVYDVSPKYKYNYMVDGGILYIVLLLLFFISAGFGFYLLFSKYKYLVGHKKDQAAYVTLAGLAAFIGGSPLFLAVYNLYDPPWYLMFINSIYPIITGYAILHHHLMDMNIMIRKGLIYSAVIALITGFYIAFITFFNQLIINGDMEANRLILSLFKLPSQSFLSGIAVLLVGLFVLIKNHRSKINIIFFLFCLSVFTWLFSFTLMYITPETDIALKWAKIGDIGILYLPILSFYFTLALLNKDKDYFLKLVYFLFALSIPILTISQTDLFFIGLKNYPWGHYPLAGPLYLSLIAFFILYIFSIVLLLFHIKKYATQYDQRKLQQLKYVLLAFIGGCTGLVDYLPKYNISIYPWGHISALLFILIIAYAILKHHLMDINVVIRKGLLYSFLAGSLSACYLSMVFISGNYLGGRKSAASILFTIFSIVFFSLIFQPLRDRIQDFIDKVFFRGKYDYQKTLKELSRAAGAIAGLDELLDKVLTAIVSVIKLNNASIYVLDKREGQYFVRKSIGLDTRRSIPENDPFIEQFTSRKEAVLFDEISRTSENIGSFMKEIGAAIVFPIISKDEPVGFLALGEKLSGEVYSNEDIDLLSTLCNQMGVSIENTMLYEDTLEAQKKLYQADKLATVGALAAGLAHEIKNPIAAIKGFSTVIGKAIAEHDKETIRDFNDVVPRQLDRINEIVEKLLTLSKPPKMEKIKTSLNFILDEIVRLVERQALKQKVEIVRNFEELPETLADPEQLTQAFLNLILNAIQSMPRGGQIEIRTKFMGTDKILTEITDNGIGIPKEKLSRIFDPFYTTKETGSGLGLAVTQKIIIDHHGKIEVESEPGKGTKFRVIIPVK